LFCEIPTMIRGIEKLSCSSFETLFFISYLVTRVFGFFIVLGLFVLSSPPKSLLLTLPPALMVGILHSFWGYKLIKKRLREKKNFISLFCTFNPVRSKKIELKGT
jgi:hypothetical protein